MGHIFKIMVHQGAENYFGEARWFSNIYRNYGKRKFIERILTLMNSNSKFNGAFEYHEFVYFQIFLHSKQIMLFPLRTYSYISGTFIHFVLVFENTFAYKTV